MIVGHGIDIVDLGEITRLLEAETDFAARCFTLRERTDAGDGSRRIERLAGRFAAKEAVLKALGTGWAQGIAWTDIEVETQPSGAPTLRLYRRAAEIAAERSIGAWFLTVSHTAEYAVASVIAISRSPE